MTTTSDLLSDGQAILAAAAAALGSRAPERQYVATGQVPYDGCDQLTVTLDPNGLSLVDAYPSKASGPTRCVAIPSASWLLECTRCVPVIQGDIFPDPQVIQDAHAEILADAETLFCALLTAAQSGSLFAGRAFTFSGVTPYGPSGAVGGTRYPISVQTSCPP